MTELSSFTEELAAQRMASQIADRQDGMPRSRPAGPRRSLTRHRVAQSLHRWANRLDD